MFAQTEVTFNATTDKSGNSESSNAASITKDGITLAISKGIMGNGEHYRCYKGETLTITSTVGNITKIEFTCTANETSQYGPGCFTKDTGKYTYSGLLGTWTGDAAKIIFTASSYQVRMTKVVVTYSPGSNSKKSANLKFEQNAYTVNVGEEIAVKATSDNTNASITYSIAEPSYGCTIDKTNGVVTAGSTAATVMVKATTEEDDTYEAEEATCTLNIINPNGIFVYQKITSTDDIVDGASYLIVNENNKKVLSPELYNYKYKSDDFTTTNIENIIQTAASNEIVFEKNGNGYSLKNSKNVYIGYGSNTDFANSSKSSVTSTDKKYIWTISFSGSGNANINCVGESKRYITFISNSNDFRAYTSSGGGPIQLYKKICLGTFTIGKNGYATYYTDDAYIMPNDVTGGIITEAAIESTEDATGTVSVSYDYEGGATVPPKTALLLKGKQGTYAYWIITSDASAPTNNLLHGADAVDENGKTYVEPTKGGTVRYYILSHSKDQTKFGFYYANTDGAAITYKKSYAFLAYEFTGTRSAMGFSLDGDNTSGINATVSDKAINNKGKVYSVTGVYVGDNLHQLPAGIYIMNGKKIVIK